MLVTEDLVAYRAPLTQVLSLRPPALERRGGGLGQLGDIFRTLASRCWQSQDTLGRRVRATSERPFPAMASIASHLPPD